VTIIIPTFRRSSLLQKCLVSCLRQIDIDPLSIEILVVDNSTEGSAATIVSETAYASAWNIRYVHEPSPGISNARNAGLSNAKGKFIAFIDDDEIVDERWLANLLKTQIKSDADVVFGPVMPMMPSSRGDLCELSLENLLTHSVEHPSGTEIASKLLVPFWARDRRAYPRLASGNFLIRRQSPNVSSLRFDPRLGQTGGEDDLFFNQMLVDGARFVWCAEAVAWEHVPPERLSLRYAIMRGFSGGQGASRIPMLLRPKRPALTVLSMIVALVQVPTFATLAAVNALTGSPRRYHYLIRMASAVGKLFWAAPLWKHRYGETGEESRRGHLDPV
jgi:glycosyltransferase involved in cell wall biosynthesis